MLKGTTLSIYAGKDLTGQRFGSLVVTGPTDKRTKSQSRVWQCLCDCGNSVEIPGSSLRPGKGRRSCGCKLFVSDTHKNWKGHGEIQGQYWSNLRYTAAARNLPFEITIEYAWQLFLDQSRKCNMTGEELTFGEMGVRREVRYEQKTASLDRIDSTQGYIVGNVQWIHKEVNYIKNKLGNERFIYWCKQVAAHHS